MQSSPLAPAPDSQTLDQLSPVNNSQRIQVLDLLRGFALIGIIFMNIEWFNRPINDLLSFDYQQTGLDWAASWLVKVFIEGKFYKLFSLLFGMGFAVMLLRAQEVGRPFGAWFTRRMLALFIFGMCHLIFLWGGDILHDYAFAGLMLLGFVLLLRTKRFSKHNHPNTFLKFGVWVIVFPLLISVIASIYFGVTRTNQVMTDDWLQRQTIIQQSNEQFAALKAQPDFLIEDEKPKEPLVNEESDEIDIDNMTPEELVEYKVDKRVERKLEQERSKLAETQAFTQSSYIEATKFRAKESLEKLAVTPIFATFICLPLFMIGYWLVASKRIAKPELYPAFFNILAWGGLTIGIIFNISGTYLTLHPAAKGAVEIKSIGDTLLFYGQLIMAAGYVGLFVKLASKTTFLKYFSWLSPLGKMALTNYITHSIILTSIFYGYAGGMFGQIARAEQMLIVIAIIFCQVFFCKFWLSHFRFGPLEWLWRSMTYMKLQPLRINQ
ncbi:DUF418 domain-containing protein [Colwelliaceae bacterium 6441]